MIGEEGSEKDMSLAAGGGRVEVSGCEMVGDTRLNGVERGEKVRVGERCTLTGELSATSISGYI